MGKLVEPLKKAKEDVEELTKKLSNYEKDKQCLSSTKRRLKQSQSDFKELAWKHEVLEQRFELCKKERDDLYRNFIKAIHEVQHKAGFKNLLLEKKIKSSSRHLREKRGPTQRGSCSFKSR